LGRLLEPGRSGVTVRALGGSRAGEIRITRFLRNARVHTTDMISHAAERTAARVAGRHILAIQDTTSLRDDGQGHSINLHPVIAVDAATGALLGLVHAEVLRRDGKAGSHKERDFADKQSRRWLTGTEQAVRLLEAGAACVTEIDDREADIYEQFALKPDGVELLIRASQDRRLAHGGKLFDAAAAVAELGRTTIRLPAAPGRKARDARLALKACPVEIARPRRRDARGLPASITLMLVEAREIDPPQGVEPAHWRLLTTHPIESFADAAQAVAFYRTRWTIEELFRLMKTKGFDVEAVRIHDEAPFEIMAAAILIAAVEVMALVRERDGAAGRPLSDVLAAEDQPALDAVCATLEGRTERQKNPHPKGSLAYAAWVCARLGGWTGYYGKPGPIVILRGLIQFRAIRHGWNLGRLL
jgi:Transposase DDE domain